MDSLVRPYLRASSLLDSADDRMSCTSWLDTLGFPLLPGKLRIVLAMGEIAEAVFVERSFHVCLCLICDTACAEMLYLEAIAAYSSRDSLMAMTSSSVKCDRPLPPVEKQSLELSPRLPKYRCSGLTQCRILTHSLVCNTQRPFGIGPMNSSYAMIWARLYRPPTEIAPYPFHVLHPRQSQCPSTLSMFASILSNSSMVLLYYGYKEK